MKMTFRLISGLAKSMEEKNWSLEYVKTADIINIITNM